MNRCPVCRRRIYPTTLARISRHRDGTGRAICPASGHPYTITEGET